MKPTSGRGAPRLTLGIDPGSRATGYGLVEQAGSGLRAVDYGVIRLDPSAGLPERLAGLFEQFEALLGRCAPDVLAVESLFTHRNARSALTLAQTRGVVLLAAGRRGVELCELAPRQIKLAVVGYGGADKRQVKGMVCRLLGLEASRVPLDASDALAVAVCEIHSSGLARALGGALRREPV